LVEDRTGQLKYPSSGSLQLQIVGQLYEPTFSNDVDEPRKCVYIYVPPCWAAISSVINNWGNYSRSFDLRIRPDDRLSQNLSTSLDKLKAIYMARPTKYTSWWEHLLEFSWVDRRIYELEAFEEPIFDRGIITSESIQRPLPTISSVLGPIFGEHISNSTDIGTGSWRADSWRAAAIVIVGTADIRAESNDINLIGPFARELREKEIYQFLKMPKQGKGIYFRPKYLGSY
jgi:hypothetical protein